eukprot:scaffold1284_cov108-Cylindrotheca_fusiformis.AAC.16
MFRLALAAFGIGILAGQCVTPFNTLASDSLSTPNKSISFKGTTKLERVKEKYGPIKRIALIGERNSGTSWITEELKQCFEAENLMVTAGLTKDKHFFQYDDATAERESTYVVAMVRNPYDWAAAMNKRPHHSPKHVRLGMEEFLTKPWTMDRPDRDLPYAKYTAPFCQLGYRYNEIVPCIRVYRARRPDLAIERKVSYSGWEAQYELRPDKSGLPFDSVMHLRQAKIKNMLEVKTWDWVADFELVHYEDLLAHGTEAFLKQIEDAIGVKIQCKPSPPAPERLSKYEQTPEVTRLINSLLDWDVEKSIGYSKKEA